MINPRLEINKIGKIRYLTGGQVKTLLLLLGIPVSAQTWQDTAKQLVKGYRVLIPNLLGFGPSAPLEGDYYLSVHARHIYTLLRELTTKPLYLWLMVLVDLLD